MTKPVPNENTSSQAPLAGVRVLDLSQVVSGPYGTLVLANLGAEVIRVDRAVGTAKGAAQADTLLSEKEAFDWGMNRNKLSICIDLKTAEGRRLLRELVPQVDVVFSNFRPGKMEALGLGREDLRKLNPRVISCELNGFGSTGPWAGMPAYDPVVQALSGTMSFTGSPDPEEMPVRWTVPIGDIFAGLFAAIGVLAALVECRRSGKGRHIEVAMHDVALAMNTYRVPLALSLDEIPVPSPNEGGQGTVPYGSFQGADGQWLAIGVSDRMWPAACKLIGREDLLAQEQLRLNRNRWLRKDEVIGAFRDALRTQPAAYWEAAFLRAGIVAGRVNTIAEVLEHPQLLARDMVVSGRDAQGRAATVIGDPLHWCAPAQVRPPSVLGQDTRRVLRDLLGLSDGQLEELRAAGAVNWAEVPADSPQPALVRRTGTAWRSEQAATEATLASVTVVELDGDEPSKGFAGRILADLGARVIKVKRPPSLKTEPYPNPKREAAYRASLDWNKSDRAIDIKQPQGRAELLDLVRDADVVLDNYRTGVLERLGLTYEQLAQVNADVVACSITGYGHTGPWAGYAAFDAAIQALAGGMSIAPIPPSMNGEPTRWGMPIGGLNGSLHAVIGILAGVLQARRDGQARPVDISLLDAHAALLCYRAPQVASAGMRIESTPRRGGTGALPFGPFRTADRRWFTMCITQQFWQEFTRVAGAPELCADPRFATEAVRRQNEQALNAIVEGLMARRTAEEWTQAFLDAELPGATVCNLVEAFEHPHVALRQLKLPVPDPEFKTLFVAGNPVKISA